MKRPKLDSTQVSRWLQDLTDTEFIAFFYDHRSARNIYRAEGRYREAHLVLGPPMLRYASSEYAQRAAIPPRASANRPNARFACNRFVAANVLKTAEDGT
jgi:hypothetical protein